MPIKINLLQKSKSYQKVNGAFQIVRKVAVIGGIITLSILVAIYSYIGYLQQQYDTAQNVHAALETQVAQVQGVETKAIVLNKKYQLMLDRSDLEQPFANDIQSILSSLPNDSTDSATISNIAFIDKQNVDFIISIPNSLQLSRVLTLLESESFRSKFGQLRVGGLSLANEADKLDITAHVTMKRPPNGQ